MANKYEGSDGTMYTQEQIDRNLSECYKKLHAGNPHPVCGCGCGRKAMDNDHTIAQARCKVIGKTELIWDPNNIEFSYRTCHQAWENFKGLKWVDHQNVLRRMKYLREHDPEGYRIRMNLSTYD